MAIPSFGKFKAFLWPIHRHEYKKFIPMFFTFFLISFIYSLLRAAKDAIIVTAPSSGAETIPFIKVWVLLPMALLVAYLFTRISNKHTTERVFYMMVSFFLLFFTLFLFVLYPYRDLLHPVAFAEKLQQHLPIGLHGLVALIRNWTFTLFYVISELWGTTILSVLFWGFANEVTSIPQAKRFYALFSVGANIATIISGETIIKLSSIKFNAKLPFGQSSWDQSLFFTLLSVIGLGLVLMVLFRFLNKKVIEKETSSKEILFNATAKIKMSMRKNFSYLMKSKYLLYIALIVVCYNITINLTEVIWKNQLKQLYPDAANFNAYMGHVFILTGILSTATALFLTGNFLRRFSWTLNALIAPAVILGSGLFFFLSLLLKNSAFLTPVASLFSMTPLALIVFLGSLQNCLARSSKFTLFDATKEIAFIPLDRESKIKGKAAIDGVASRMGKSGGSVIYQALLINFSTIAAASSYIAAIFFAVVVIWIFSVRLLGRQFNLLTSSKEPLPTEPEAQPVK
ncbi:MAG: Npt1/Npt2 family nucleotide transporter [Parachlamydiales bacterium]|jgi:AAA family ATP:ADP antiporter